MGVDATLRDILLERGHCSARDIEQAEAIQAEYGGTLGSILLNLGAVSDEAVTDALARQYGLERFADLPKEKRTKVEIASLSPSFLLEHDIYPLFEDKALYLVLHNPLQIDSVSTISRQAGRPVRLFLATQEELRDVREMFEAPHEEVEEIFEDEVDKLKELASEAPVIKLVNNIFTKAAQGRVSDIHFESFKSGMKVRYRLDGVLKTVETIPLHLKQAVTARLKLISKMNIAENRLPQDGRITVKIAGNEIDIRSSSVPTAFGESFVLRLLSKESVELSVDALGLHSDNVRLLKEMLKKPNGIILTTGPTGSGKTSTLYAALNYINSDDIKIITVEDPVEYQLDGVSQIQVKSAIDYTFAKALRSILRQDPDIIMIGEIRDRETAEIAVQSALTGHLVLSTLHTNSALGAITRLMDIGIEYYLLKSSVVGLMAQRLVRKLCDHCKQPLELTPQLRSAYSIDALLPHLEGTLQPCTAKGCEACSFTGYKGRQPIMEIVPFDEKLMQCFDDNPDFSDIRSLGYRSLLDDGLLKFLEGKTSLDEVVRLAQ